jgi:hypothetical protein
MEIPTITSTLLSYHPRSHSTSNCTYFWDNPPFSHDQALRWSLTLVFVREMLYQFTSHILCLRFCNAFVTHFSPHQFKVATKGGYETIIHGIKCALDLHLNWFVFQLTMVIFFNLMLKNVIFQKLHATSGDII